MATLYPTPQGDSVRPIVDAVRDQRRQTRDLQRPSGTRLASLVAQVQATLANIYTLVISTVNTFLSTGTVNMANINASGDIAAAGRVSSAAAFRSLGSYGYHVVTGYQAMWINNDGTIGVSASNRDSKTDLVPLTDSPVLSLRPMLGRYVWDSPDAPLKQFLIAEEVYEAGYGPDVVPLDEDGKPLSINYSQLIPSIITTMQQMAERIERLENPTA